MKSKFIQSVVGLCAVIFSQIAVIIPAQAVTDSRGKEFYFSHLPNYSTAAPLALFISAEFSASGTVAIDGLGFLESFTVDADSSTTVILPSSAANLPTGQISNYAIHVVADNDITVYGLNRALHTTDAFLALPLDSLGTDYLVSTYATILGSEFSVIGAYDNTSVTIDSVNSSLPLEISLNRGETYLVRTSGSADLTGSRVTSTAPVAVVAGSFCTNVPSGARACDHIVEQMPPISTWGKEVITYPLGLRTRGDLFRILASQEETTVQVSSTEQVVLNGGEYHSGIYTDALQISADKPILVTQFSVGQTYDGVLSDPFMMIVPPVEQYLNNYTFSALDSDLNINNNFANVIINSDFVSSLSLDGSPIDETLFFPIGISAYSGAQIPIIAGAHNIKSNFPFGLSAYGFGFAESYGYPGGMAFEPINPIGDKYIPNIVLEKLSNVVMGKAGDFEDLNLNGNLDAGEDTNQNGSLDFRTEDSNGNGLLDDGEDTNDDGFLDKDTGVRSIELSAESENLNLVVDLFVPGEELVTFTITQVDPELLGAGIVIVTDLAGNKTEQEVVISNVPVLLDVDVISTLSTQDIELKLASFAKTPADIQYNPNNVVIKWHYIAFASNQQDDLNYSVSFKNPTPLEERVVTQKLEVRYVDESGEQINITLDEQVVKVLATYISIKGQTDKQIYSQSETILSSFQAENLTGIPTSHRLRATLQDINGITVTTLYDESGLAFEGEELKTFSGFSYDAINMTVGDYLLVVELLNEEGLVDDRATSGFTVVSDIDQIAILRTTTDKPEYHTTDRVELENLARNLSTNQAIDNAQLVTKLVLPNGDQLTVSTEALSSFNAGAVVGRSTTYALDNAEVGTYQVIGEIISDEGELLATDTAEFVVVESLVKAIQGTVTVASEQVGQGELQSCSDVIQNTGTANLDNQLVRQVLVRVDVTEELTSSSYEFNIVANDEVSLARDVDTSSLEAGFYGCVLQAQIEGEWNTLDSAIFEVTEPLCPIPFDEIEPVIEYESVENIVQNWSFEEHPRCRNGLYCMYRDLPHWWASPLTEIQIGNIGGIAANHGSRKLELDAHRNGSVMQKLDTQPGAIYSLSLNYSPRVEAAGTNTNDVSVWWNGEQIDLLSGDTIGWETYTYQVKATSKKTTLRFEAEGRSDSYGGLIDNISAYCSSCSSSSVLVNGSFEQHGAYNYGSWGTFSSIPGWSAVNLTVPFELQHGNTAGIHAKEGDTKLELDANSYSAQSQITQTVPTRNGQDYELSLHYSPRISYSTADTNDVGVYWNDTLVDTLSGTQKGWSKHSWNVSSFDTSGQLMLKGLGRLDTLGGLIDDIALTCKVEPTNLIENGSFEQHSALNHGSWGTFVSIPSWTAGTSRAFELQHGNTGGIAGQHGNYKVELDAYANSTIVQSVVTEVQGQYTLSLWYSPRVNWRQRPHTNDVEVWWNGNKLATLSGRNKGWKQYQFDVESATTVTQLEFKAAGRSDSYGGLIDNISLYAKPAIAEVSSDPTLEILVGEDYSYTLDVDGIDPADRHFTLEQGPEGMQLVGDTLQWAPGYPGEYTIRVRVTDGCGRVARQSFVVVVEMPEGCAIDE